MGKYFSGTEAVRVEFPDGNWIDVKEELTQDDQDYILSQLTKTETTNNKANLSITIGRMALLEKAIVAWSFTEDGKPVPVNRENISHLRIKYRAKTLTEIDRLNTEAMEFVSKNV